MELDDRQCKIISDIVDLIGDGVVMEWVANASTLTTALLRVSNNRKPDDLEDLIALNYFYLEALKKKFNVDPEIFALDLKKCYLEMEKIMSDALAIKAQSSSKEVDTLEQDPLAPLIDLMDNFKVDPYDDRRVALPPPTDSESGSDDVSQPSDGDVTIP